MNFWNKVTQIQELTTVSLYMNTFAKDYFQDAAKFFQNRNHDVHGPLDCILHQMNFKRNPVYSSSNRV